MKGSLIESSIQPILKKNQPIVQAGFRTGFSTNDHIIQKVSEFKMTDYMGFMDYEKANVLYFYVQSSTIPGIPLEYIRINRNIGKSSRHGAPVMAASRFIESGACRTKSSVK